MSWGGQKTWLTVTTCLYSGLPVTVWASPFVPGASLRPCSTPGCSLCHLAVPHSAQHPQSTHPPGPGVPETPNALGTTDNPSALTELP